MCYRGRSSGDSPPELHPAAEPAGPCRADGLQSPGAWPPDGGESGGAQQVT